MKIDDIIVISATTGRNRARWRLIDMNTHSEDVYFLIQRERPIQKSLQRKNDHENNIQIRFMALVWSLLLAPFSATYSQYFRGYLQSPQGNADCNPCVQNVIHSVNTLRDRGETMGFNWGANYPSVDHWQGIQRMPILPNEGLSLPYIVVSSSHGGQSKPYARFAIVTMGSRDQDGLRFRSNRLAYGQLTKDVPPDSRDQIVVPKIIRTDYDHAGGVQTIGSICWLVQKQLSCRIAAYLFCRFSIYRSQRTIRFGKNQFLKMM
jgi:hypothetical protein